MKEGHCCGFGQSIWKRIWANLVFFLYSCRVEHSNKYEYSRLNYQIHQCLKGARAIQHMLCLFWKNNQWLITTICEMNFILSHDTTIFLKVHSHLSIRPSKIDRNNLDAHFKNITTSCFVCLFFNSFPKKVLHKIIRCHFNLF